MAKTTSWVFGVIFIIAGVWGFFAQPAVGFVAAGWLSSLVHVVVGVVLLALASKPSAVTALKTVGILYVVFAILAFMQGSSVLWTDAFPADAATSWFYLVVGIVIAALGFSAKNGEMAAPAAPAAPAQM